MGSTAVIGAGGPTGSECVKRLLELGQPAVAIVRDPQKYKNAFENDKNLRLLSGDVTDAASLRSAFKEGHVNNVIFAASGKTYWSAKSVDEQVSLQIRAILHLSQDLSSMTLNTRASAATLTCLAGSGQYTGSCRQ